MRIICSARGLQLNINPDELDLLQRDLRLLKVQPKSVLIDEDGTTLEYIAGAARDAGQIVVNVEYMKRQKAARAAQKKGKKP